MDEPKPVELEAGPVEPSLGVEPLDGGPDPLGDSVSPEPDFEVPDPFDAPYPVGEDSLPPTAAEGEPSSLPDEPVSALVLSPKPRFGAAVELEMAFLQFLAFFPRGESASPGHRGVSRKGILSLCVLCIPTLLILGVVAAGFAAGLGSVVGDELRISASASGLALFIDLCTCGLIALGSTLVVSWAARLTRSWNTVLVSGLAGLGAFTVAAAVFLPLFGDSAIAPVEGWLGPFRISWIVVGLGLLGTPTAAVLLASATVSTGRICPGTGRVLSPALRLRLGIPEGLAACQAVQEGRYEELAELGGVDETVHNFVELTLWAAEGAELALLELEARFWAEVGPRERPEESAATMRRTRRWLVSSTAISTNQAVELLGLEWRSLEPGAE